MRFFDFWKSRKKRRVFEENEVWKKSKTRLNAACLRCQKQVEKAEKRKECRKHENEHCKRCAEACEACAKSCREMGVAEVAHN